MLRVNAFATGKGYEPEERAEEFCARLLATIVVGGLRLGNEQWQKSSNTDLSKV
jgi:hypothetical protein